MYIYILFLLTNIASAIEIFLAKIFQQNLIFEKSQFILYNFFNSLFATLFFFLMTQMHIDMNITTFIYSAVYAGLIVTILIAGVYCYSKVSITTVSITNTAGNIIISAVAGILLFNEAARANLIISVILMLFATVLPYINDLKNENGIKIHPCCIITFFCMGANSIILKMYTQSTKVCDSYSFFFMTNFILLIISAAYLFIYMHTNHESLPSLIKAFSVKQIANIGGRTVLSNITSLINIIIIAHINLSAYTIVASSLALIFGAVLSKFCFKEQISFNHIAAIILSIAAIIVHQL